MTNELTFDSDTIAERDRFEVWREMFCSKLWGLDIVHSDSRPFFARCRFVSLGTVGVIRSELNGLECRRTLRRVRQEESDDFGFHVSLSGGVRAAQGKCRAEMPCAAGMLLASGQPYALSTPQKPRNAHYQCYSLHLPRKGLLRRVPRAERHLAEICPGGEPMHLLMQYLNLVAGNDMDLQSPDLRRLAGEHVLDLIALALEPGRELDHRVEMGGLRAARRMALLRYLEQHYRDEGLSVKSVAAALGISESYLHRLMAESGESFTEMVNRLRLERAKRMLEDPECDGLRIGEIAFATGFSDFTYFNRLFRRRFGDTPRAFRADRPERGGTRR
ncbi:MULTISPECIES: helix-turn-helix domain-containing protein [Methylococcus]|uniref:Helix-turn-helix domain-containing protein n=1 Tax=Methylococcus capsulatus TaxID=414 RepID=A0ABZ2F9W0_METCP|nr:MULTISPECIES: helix-turn-helix domain-containing protein [Methylococcus]MDF9392890.1 helix-turn-helix domain-containing protein [Methylococcus capsulatus]